MRGGKKNGRKKKDGETEEKGHRGNLTTDLQLGRTALQPLSHDISGLFVWRIIIPFYHMMGATFLYRVKLQCPQYFLFKSVQSCRNSY